MLEIAAPKGDYPLPPRGLAIAWGRATLAMTF